ncbi:EF hand family protein [Tritrichomonas foetus]|uniref:EF hand family protein n=1 Tax=Tritrichomonas foetus TaxID=1144522 RepID=A0A1J4J9N4_9EUKA|nr:EF hand family protein [Tritrichomonas foetus]|eukprot:OHS95902.1 EF hand family protein [Tritrichomonas foetus]
MQNSNDSLLIGGESEPFEFLTPSDPPKSTEEKSRQNFRIRYLTRRANYITRLRRAFDSADSNKLGRITLDQWMKSDIHQYIKEGTLSEEDFKFYFWRIDANCDHYITWDELVQYLMKEISQSELHLGEQATQFLQKTSKGVPSRDHTHREMVKQITICENSSEYITLSSDSIRFWGTFDLQFRRSINDPGLFASMLVFETHLKLAVATSNRRLLLYDIDSLQQLPCEINASPSSVIIKKMTQREAKNALNKLNSTKLTLYNAPTVMALAKYTLTPPLTLLFFVCDDQGFVQVFQITAPQRRQSTAYKINCISKYRMHDGNITQFSCIESYECYATSSTDGSIKFWQYDTKSRRFEILRVLNDTSAIITFKFSEKQKLIVTCGVSRDAYVWSISPPQRIFKLGGHYNTVVAITDYITSTNERYLLTMTNRKEFRLWDAVSYRMSREWNDPTLLRPENHYSAILYDERRHAIITAASYPVRWSENAAMVENFLEKTTHKHTIVGCHYTKCFNQIITIDSIANFCVWNVKNGQLSSMRESEWDPNLSDISTTVLDYAGRRLVTVDFRNNFDLWNFNSGQIIAKLDLQLTQEENKYITSCLSYLKIGGREFLAKGGWDKALFLFTEIDKGKFVLFRKFTGHTYDISTIAPYEEGVISGSANGEVFTWALDTNFAQAGIILKPSAAVEIIYSHHNFALIGDSLGNIHIFTIPKLELVDLIVSAHNLIVPYAITSIDSYEDTFYSTDTFGYVKKWKIEGYPDHFKAAPVEIYRCHNIDIFAISVVMDGKFVVTTGADMNVKIFDAETFEYVGIFHYESNWDIFDKTTWAMKNNCEVETKHFNHPQNELSSNLPLNDQLGLLDSSTQSLVESGPYFLKNRAKSGLSTSSASFQIQKSTGSFYANESTETLNLNDTQTISENPQENENSSFSLNETKDLIQEFLEEHEKGEFGFSIKKYQDQELKSLAAPKIPRKSHLLQHSMRPNELINKLTTCLNSSWIGHPVPYTEPVETKPVVRLPIMTPGMEKRRFKAHRH